MKMTPLIDTVHTLNRVLYYQHTFIDLGSSDTSVLRMLSVSSPFIRPYSFFIKKNKICEQAFPLS